MKTISCPVVDSNSGRSAICGICRQRGISVWTCARAHFTANILRGCRRWWHSRGRAAAYATVVLRQVVLVGATVKFIAWPKWGFEGTSRADPIRVRCACTPRVVWCGIPTGYVVAVGISTTVATVDLRIFVKRAAGQFVSERERSSFIADEVSWPCAPVPDDVGCTVKTKAILPFRRIDTRGRPPWRGNCWRPSYAY